MRTPKMQALARTALHRLLVEMRQHVEDVTVIGGLNPPLLAPSSDAPHQGTVDVDLVLDLAPVYDREEQDFGWLEVALARAGFEPSADDGGWRWSTLMGDARIHLDVLCDVLDNPGRQLALPGTRTVTAMNVQGPVAALGDVARRPASVRLDDTSPEVTLEIRYAGLGGYLLAKSAALVSRAASKDFYDLASARSSAPH